MDVYEKWLMGDWVTCEHCGGDFTRENINSWRYDCKLFCSKECADHYAEREYDEDPIYIDAGEVLKLIGLCTSAYGDTWIPNTPPSKLRDHIQSLIKEQREKGADICPQCGYDPDEPDGPYIPGEGLLAGNIADKAIDTRVYASIAGDIILQARNIIKENDNCLYDPERTCDIDKYTRCLGCRRSLNKEQKDGE